MKEFQTERLIIRPTNKSDATFIYELLNTPKWIKYIGDRNIKSIKNAEQYITAKMLPQLEKLGYSNNTVIRKIDQIKIGTCGLYNREGVEGVDIGFAFLPQYENKGYAYESTSNLITFAQNEFNIQKISAITLPENKSSQKLLRKLGLKFIKMIKIPNDDADLCLFQRKFH